jgi:hypothetical protein
MSDPNIRLLLHRVSQSWEKSGHRHDRPKSFVFLAETGAGSGTGELGYNID